MRVHRNNGRRRRRPTVWLGPVALVSAGCIGRGVGFGAGQAGGGTAATTTGGPASGTAGPGGTQGSSGETGSGSGAGVGTGTASGTAAATGGSTGASGATGAVGSTGGGAGGTEPPPWVTVTAGRDHTCAVFQDGTLWCWGRNDYGQLGVGGGGPIHPAPVQVGDLDGWTQVAGGFAHTCGLRQDGTLWCWGDGAYGQLGVPDTLTTATPIQVGDHADWAWVTTRFRHTCGLRTDGSAWCWGLNGSGQIGDGTWGEGADRNAPVPVAPGTVWKDLAAGAFHTCGIRDDGTLWCWGDNLFGQVGDGTYDMRPLPVPLGVGADWVQVEAGNLFSCALRADGTVWCWGNGEWGQLGNGQEGIEATRNTPEQLGTDDDWARLGLGEFHGCGIRTDGSLWCWGYDVMAVSRDNFGSILTNPVSMGGGTDWTFVHGGGAHTCGLRSDLSLWCWGDDSTGAVGAGTLAPQAEMTPIAP